MAKSNGIGILFIVAVIAVVFLYHDNLFSFFNLSDQRDRIELSPDGAVHSVSFEEYRADIKVYKGAGEFTGECIPAETDSSYCSCAAEQVSIDSNGCPIYACHTKEIVSCSKKYLVKQSASGNYGGCYEGFNSGFCYVCLSPKEGCTSNLGSPNRGGSKTKEICQFDYALYKNNSLVSSSIASRTSFRSQIEPYLDFVFGESTLGNDSTETRTSGTKEVCSWSTVFNNRSKTYESSLSCSDQSNIITVNRLAQCENMMGAFIFKIPSTYFTTKFSLPPSKQDKGDNQAGSLYIKNSFRDIEAIPCLTYKYNLLGENTSKTVCQDKTVIPVGERTILFSFDSSLPLEFEVQPSLEKVTMQVNGVSKEVGSISEDWYKMKIEYNVIQTVTPQIENTTQAFVYNTTTNQSQIPVEKESWWVKLWHWFLSLFNRKV